VRTIRFSLQSQAKPLCGEADIEKNMMCWLPIAKTRPRQPPSRKRERIVCRIECDRPAKRVPQQALDATNHKGQGQSPKPESITKPERFGIDSG